MFISDMLHALMATYYSCLRSVNFDTHPNNYVSRPSCFCFNDSPTTNIYTNCPPLALPDALPISSGPPHQANQLQDLLTVDKINALVIMPFESAKSEEHTSELQSLMRISYAVFCLKKKITYPTK